MKLSYIFHSGFVLETEQSILLFDYWMDPSGVMDGVLRSEKPMYVFSSHFHEDHFTKEIFEWKKQRKDITYILSKDIYKHRRANKEDADVWLAKGGTWSDDTISVWALGSTDSGVSWIVETEDKAAIKREQSQACLDSAEREQARPKVKRIFHAGDLNNWYAKFLTDDNPDQLRYSFEMEETFNPIAHEKQFLGELKDIRKVADSFDVVMFPIDGRVGNGYTIREYKGIVHESEMETITTRLSEHLHECAVILRWRHLDMAHPHLLRPHILHHHHWHPIRKDALPAGKAGPFTFWKRIGLATQCLTEYNKLSA